MYINLRDYVEWKRLMDESIIPGYVVRNGFERHVPNNVAEQRRYVR